MSAKPIDDGTGISAPWPMPTTNRIDPVVIDAKPPVCPYCRKPAPGWFVLDLERGGRRWAGDTLQYHCYEAYCCD